MSENQATTGGMPAVVYHLLAEIYSGVVSDVVMMDEKVMALSRIDVGKCKPGNTRAAVTSKAVAQAATVETII